MLIDFGFHMVIVLLMIVYYNSVLSYNVGETQCACRLYLISLARGANDLVVTIEGLCLAAPKVQSSSVKKKKEKV